MGATGGTDVGTGAFDPWPAAAQVHLEWGPAGAALAAERGDVVVVVDLLSLSTTVTLAVSRGATALVHSATEVEAMGGREAAATTLGAEAAARDRNATAGRFSLSPSTVEVIGRGERVLFTSLNGAACIAAAAAAPLVLVAALVNRAAARSAVETALRRGTSSRCTLVPCGELWSSASPGTSGWRPGVEDLLAAGAIAASLAGDHDLSAEAHVAAASFLAVEADLVGVLGRCTSGRELVERGFAPDLTIASEVDVVDVVPAWRPAGGPRELVPFDPDEIR